MRFSIRFVAVVASCAFGCSASTSTSTGSSSDACTSDAPAIAATGGASVRLVGAACPDANTDVVIALRDVDGNLRLVGATNGATVSCRVGATRFEASVSFEGATFSVSGSLSGMTSSDAKVSVKTSALDYSTHDKPCSVTLTMNADGRLRGSVSCSSIEQNTSLAACSFATEPTPSFFSFTGCGAL